MDIPKIADTTPSVTTLEPGTYWWCRCGLSSNQPFCDGSHKGTSFSPLELVIEETQKVALCRCKHSQNSPFCDGSHKHLAS
ncbi:MAG: CDGSH iron-sulfur domain-containing protein [Vulcanimicrobiota bacterium]